MSRWTGVAMRELCGKHFEIEHAALVAYPDSTYWKKELADIEAEIIRQWRTGA